MRPAQATEAEPGRLGKRPTPLSTAWRQHSKLEDLRMTNVRQQLILLCKYDIWLEGIQREDINPVRKKKKQAKIIWIKIIRVYMFTNKCTNVLEESL